MDNKIMGCIERELMTSYVDVGDTRAEYKAKKVAIRIANELSALNKQIEAEGEKKKSDNTPMSDLYIPYLKCEAEHQIVSMTELFGHKPAMIEQGVNALIHMILNPELYDIHRQELSMNYELNQPVQNDFPDIDFRRDIANELSREELIDRLCEMNENYKAMREEWFNKTQLNQPTTEESKAVVKENLTTEKRTAEEILLKHQPRLGSISFSQIVAAMEEYAFHFHFEELKADVRIDRMEEYQREGLPTDGAVEPEEISVDNIAAIKFITENQYQDAFVSENCHLTNQEGGDNSFELTDYWQRQYVITIEYVRSQLQSRFLNDIGRRRSKAGKAMTNGHHLTRVITYMGYPSLEENPQSLLSGGSKVITLPDKIRYFTVRKVFYDETITPMYTIPSMGEPKCKSLAELKEKYPVYAPAFDSVILDNNHSLKVWDGE